MMQNEFPNCAVFLPSVFTARGIDKKQTKNRANWTNPTLTLPSQAEARAFLDARLLGMEDVKEVLLQLLEKIHRSGDLSANLLLYGPPGAGKTTIVKAFCELLQLPMTQFSMAACSDGEMFTGFS